MNSVNNHGFSKGHYWFSCGGCWARWKDSEKFVISQYRIHPTNMNFCPTCGRNLQADNEKDEDDEYDDADG